VPHPLRVDEQTLLGILNNDYFADPAFLNQGELTAAAEALRHHDAAPFLRLRAESPSPTDFGNPHGLFSVGSTCAVFCSDGSTRLGQERPGDDARSAVPDGAGRAACECDRAVLTGRVDRIRGRPADPDPAGRVRCVPWPTRTRPNPPFPEGQPFPAGVPALLLGGGLDYLDVNGDGTPPT
jgi:hypothetical protein